MMIRLMVALCITFCAFAAEAGPRRRPAEVSAKPFMARAYCLTGKTHSGAQARPGTVAADPRVLPIGSRIRIESGGGGTGTYTVADTGGGIKGRKVDIFMRSCRAAKSFGVRRVRVAVLRRGPGPETSVAER